jgi:hypothetical protein
VTELCENSDHDGAEVPAVARISDPWTTTLRCTYCAEGWMTALVRKGIPFTVTPIGGQLT